jgi:hypothetical protein
MAIQAYIQMLPALNTIGMRDGAHAESGRSGSQIPEEVDQGIRRKRITDSGRKRITFRTCPEWAIHLKRNP